MKHLIQNIVLPALGLLLLQQPLPAWAGNEPDAHGTALCGDCHSGGIAPQHNAELIARQCSDCHDSQTLAVQSASGHHQGANQCLDCHSFHDPSQIAVAKNAAIQVPLSAIDSAQCQGCHGAQSNLKLLSAAHRKAAELYHDQAKQLQHANASETCLNCHSNLSASDWQAKTDGAVLAFNEHGSHPYGVNVVPGSGNSSNWIAWEIDQRLPLFDGRMECQTCHQLTAGTDDLLIPFETKYDLCKGCHRQYGDEKSGQLVANLNR